MDDKKSEPNKRWEKPISTSVKSTQHERDEKAL